MEISVKLLQYKYYFAAMIALSLVMAIFVTVAPDFLVILSYFLPLFLSTTLFLVAIIVFSQSATEFYSQGDSEGLLDFVARRPEELEEY